VVILSAPAHERSSRSFDSALIAHWCRSASFEPLQVRIVVGTECSVGILVLGLVTLLDAFVFTILRVRDNIREPSGKRDLGVREEVKVLNWTFIGSHSAPQ
jgi:hypothetical protein